METPAKYCGDRNAGLEITVTKYSDKRGPQELFLRPPL